MPTDIEFQLLTWAATKSLTKSASMWKWKEEKRLVKMEK